MSFRQQVRIEAIPRRFHSATTPVINGDNKMITRGHIGCIIWIIQIIKRFTDTADNNF